MIIYLLIGLLVSLLFDWVMDKIDIPELQFTNSERVIIIFIWPFAIIWAIYSFFKNKNNNDKGN
jgi:hypothetical protein